MATSSQLAQANPTRGGSSSNDGKEESKGEETRGGTSSNEGKEESKGEEEARENEINNETNEQRAERGGELTKKDDASNDETPTIGKIMEDQTGTALTTTGMWIWDNIEKITADQLKKKLEEKGAKV